MGKQTWDYVIIGGGSAGCVLANRLSADPGTSVLLLEAGGSHRHPLISTPLGYGLTVNSPRFAYQFRSGKDDTTHGRQHQLPRGRVLGGSSSINGMIYIRGQHQDYDNWAQLGATGWDWESVRPYFVGSVSQQHGASEWHSDSGPLRIEDNRNQFAACEALIKSGINLGIPRNDDFNGRSQEGIGHYQTTMRGGRRWSAANAYIDPVRQRENLSIKTGIQVDRIAFDGSRAVAVNTSAGDFAARQEIILAAGAYGSPQLLQVSGIGPRHVLETLDVKPVLVHDSVGRNLQDHAGPPMAWRLHRTEDSVNRNLTPSGMIGSLLKYLVTRRGPVSMPAAAVGLFVKSSEDLSRPDLQFHCLPVSGNDSDDASQQQVDPFPGFTMMPYLMHPASRGAVTAISADISVQPHIETNYFQAESDLKAVVSGMRLAERLAQTKPFAALVQSRIRPHADLIAESELEDYARTHAHTGYHPVGTCRMGTDQNAVVDPDCRLTGTENLRVIDASVMPSLISGNTHAATVMIAEKVSDAMINNRGS